ncbi:GNAT family N-acetyltransferase [Bacillus sp. 31A1R]|uniref:GNAT family N-acetyltransferase n=1 Tax=Robertmurraya mangrovi TaxID=3098077 RepID=A0ABU5J570_9BACI|nr:GNAT family N-acetyltransferase [Bacillus sp. 31A1R]MDZ5474487.1 GNAT family N-acetyltransferase [Bacillus sp. 31A1R]
MEIRRATQEELDLVVELFDGYRTFYNQPYDKEGARKFIYDRMLNNESMIFLAFEEDEAIGFTQLYPTFSSVSMRKSLILNDLYVKTNARRKGVGEALINKAFEYAKEIGAKGVLLETGRENTKAQALYEKMGFTLEDNHFYYFTL